MNNYYPRRQKSTFAGILAIIFAILSIINLIFVTTWFSYLTPLLLIVDFILAVYWISKKDAVMIIPIIATLTQLFPISSIFQIRSRELTYDTPASIKVASYNVGTFHHNHRTTTTDVIAIMQKEDVDIICFQEFVEDCDSSVFYQKFSCYPSCCIQDQKHLHTTRLAIFSRWPIVGEHKIIFQNNINSAMSADIDINGQIIRVINCHMQTTGINQNRKFGGSTAIEGATDNTVIRNEQINAVADYIDKTTVPIILCGDFNDPPISYTYRIVNRKLNDGFKQGGTGFASSFIGGFKSLLRIDYIFHSDELDCTNYVHADYMFSDHKPVISTLEFKVK